MFSATPPPFTAGRIPFGQAAAAGTPTVHHAPLTGKAAARRQRMVKAAAELCPVLPEPGEHVHCLMTGYFDLAQVLADVARRTSPRAVRIATLCWSKRNVPDLAAVMAAAGGAPLVLVVSDYFRAHNKELVNFTRDQLAPFGGVRIVPCRSHAKVTTFDLGPGDGLVFEGSANLRTNRNQEQLTIIRDRGVHDWHAAWIDRLAREKA